MTASQTFTEIYTLDVFILLIINVYIIGCIVDYISLVRVHVDKNLFNFFYFYN